MLPIELQNSIRLLSTPIQDLIAEISSYFEQELAQKNARIQELEGQVAKNSQNSSKPPSTNTLYDKPAPKSRRKKTERKIGGQYGQKGKNLKMVEVPDERILYKVTHCACCGEDLSNCVVNSVRRRQAYDHTSFETHGDGTSSRNKKMYLWTHDPSRFSSDSSSLCSIWFTYQGFSNLFTNLPILALRRQQRIDSRFRLMEDFSDGNRGIPSNRDSRINISTKSLEEPKNIFVKFA